MSTSSSSSPNMNNTNAQNVGIGVVSFSSSNTPFSSSTTNQAVSTTQQLANPMAISNQQAQQVQQQQHQQQQQQQQQQMSQSQPSFNVNNSTSPMTNTMSNTNRFGLVNGVLPGTLVHHSTSNHGNQTGNANESHYPVYSCVSPTSSSILNSQLYSTASNNGTNQNQLPGHGNNNSINHSSSTGITNGQSNNSYCNISTLQSHHHHHHHHGSSTSTMQTQMHPQGLTVTLIATIPTSAASNSSQNTSQSSQILTATPLMPLIQPLIQSQPQISQLSTNQHHHQTSNPVASNNSSIQSSSSSTQQQQPPVISSPLSTAPLSAQPSTPISTTSSGSLVPQKPSTSAVSSSSSSPISSAQNLSSTTRDWFTYVYKIDNIEDLIKNHESQQNFVQSPIFSFTNHIIPANPTTTTSPTNTNTSPSSSTQNFNQSSPQFSNNNTGIGGSGGIGVPIYTTNTQSSSSSSTSSSSMTSTTPDQNKNSQSSLNKNLPTNKKPSNWRLIFYPNGAGTDCKNFLSIFLKYLSDEPVKIQMMFSIVDNLGEDVYVKYTVNKFCKSNDWGFKQLIHKNAILYQKEKFLKPYNGGTLSVRVKMRLDEQKHDYIKKLNDNLHYCKLLSENFSQYYYNNNMLKPVAESEQAQQATSESQAALTTTTCLASSSTQPSESPLACAAASSSQAMAASSSSSSSNSVFDPVVAVTHVSGKLVSGINPANSVSVGELCTNGAGASVFNGASADSESNSSYYDILLIVKSKSNVSENSSLAPSVNYSMCTNCVASRETISRISNRRSYSCLLDNSDSEPSSPSAKRLKTVSSSASTASINHQLQSILTTTTTTNTKCQCATSTEPVTKTELIELRAHKCILAARSPVFKAMFNHKLKENLTNRVLIEDCRPDVVQAMLKYIYTAYLPDDIKDIAIDLYIAAEKYFIESLKIKCREYLVENLNTDSVVQTYILAELYNDSMLRKQSLKFISENIDRVTQDQYWNEFMSCYPQLFTNAFIRLCKKDF